MAQSGLPAWSKTANSNQSSDSAVNWQENQAPSSVNDSARGMMASTAKWRDDNSGSLVTAGSSTAYTLTTNTGMDALAANYQVAFQLDEDCGISPTLNVDGKGAKPLRPAAGVEFVAGQLKGGGVYAATYFTSNSGEWIVHAVNPVLLADSQVATAKIADKAVTYAKIQDVSATARVIGRKTVSAGVAEECSLSDVLDMVGSATRGDILVRGASSWGRAALAGQGAVLRSDGTDSAFGSQPVFHIQETQSQGTTSSNATTANTWLTRTLNATILNEISGASLSSNQITLPAGTYDVEAEGMAYCFANSNIVQMRVRLQNITGSATLLNGIPQAAAASSTIIAGVFISSQVRGRITLAGTTVLELQFRANSALSAINGFNSGTEVYSDVFIQKVA